MTLPLRSNDFFKSKLGTFIDWHLKYGFSVFPIHGITADGHCTCRDGAACSHPGKHPYTMHGFKDASRDHQAIAKMFDGRDDLNIGIATGKASNVLVIDIDGEAGEKSWQAISEGQPDQPVQPGMIFKTGKGRHLLFRYPGVAVKCRQKLGGYEGIDVRADSGYIVAPPSTHHSGRKYGVVGDSYRLGIPHAPSWLLALVMADTPRKERPVDYGSTSGAVPQWSVGDVQRMLSYLDPSVQYKEWVDIGMALHAGGFPLSMWDEWSSGGSQYKPGCCNSHWRSFKHGQGITMGTLVDRARLHGWKPEQQAREREPGDISGVSSFAEKARVRWEAAADSEPGPHRGRGK